MLPPVTKRVMSFVDGTRTIKEISVLAGVSTASVYRIVKQQNAQDMVVSGYDSRHIRAMLSQQRKALKAIIQLDPNTPQAKLAKMGLEPLK